MNQSDYRELLEDLLHLVELEQFVRTMPDCDPAKLVDLRSEIDELMVLRKLHQGL